MLAIVYILSISIAVTFKYNGVQTDFYTKYFIAAAWTALWIADVIRKGGLLQKQDLFFLKKVSMPPLIIFLWTIVLWVINRPERLNGAIMQTTVSNILALILATTCAISAAHFFGEKSILYTGLSIALSTFFNTIAVVPRYGIATFINYLKVAFIVTDLDYSSSITRLSLDLEVHDSTIACGVLIVYYLFFYNKRQDKENKFLQIIMICLMSICLYIGFKRLPINLSNKFKIF